MSVYLTDKTRVKALLHGSTLSSDADSLLDLLIPGVSATMEREMGRHIERTSRTELLEVAPRQTRWWLDGVPVTSVTSVRHDVERDFGSDTELDADNWYCRANDRDSGILEIRQGLAPGTDVLRVVYVGGLGASLASIAAADGFPDLVEAATLQCAHEFQRRDQLGGGSMSGGGDVSVIYDTVDLLATVRKACRRRRLLQAQIG